MKTMQMTDRKICDQYSQIMKGYNRPPEPTVPVRDHQGQFKKAGILREGRVTYMATTARKD